MEVPMALDRTTAALRAEIEKASEALVQTSRQAPGRRWSPEEIQAAAKNGESYAAVSLALSRLIENGTFIVEQDKIRLNV
jgi:hypothetical protein